MIQDALTREARAWRTSSAPEYKEHFDALMTKLRAEPQSDDRTYALITLASRVLRRSSSVPVESQARVAEELLALLSQRPKPEFHSRIRLLVLLAWLRLAEIVAHGPASVQVNPPLPPGVNLPAGVAPAEISNPTLRKQAEQAVERHAEEVERWNAKQRALGHLNHIATLVESITADREDVVMRDLVAAMSLAPGLSENLRRRLRGGSEPSAEVT